jgi:hypothetical protein
MYGILMVTTWNKGSILTILVKNTICQWEQRCGHDPAENSETCAAVSTVTDENLRTVYCSCEKKGRTSQ